MALQFDAYRFGGRHVAGRHREAVRHGAVAFHRLAVFIGRSRRAGWSDWRRGAAAGPGKRAWFVDLRRRLCCGGRGVRFRRAVSRCGCRRRCCRRCGGACFCRCCEMFISHPSRHSIYGKHHRGNGRSRRLCDGCDGRLIDLRQRLPPLPRIGPNQGCRHRARYADRNYRQTLTPRYRRQLHAVRMRPEGLFS